MSTNTQIQWTDATWNPIRGCSLVSAGCTNCYAMGVAARFSGPGLAYEGLARRRSNGKPQWTGEVRVIESHMNDPLKWRKPRRIFVNSMSDLFHENVSDETIDRVFAVMALAWHHTYQILTKRPARMLRYFTERDAHLAMTRQFVNFRDYEKPVGPWPLPNVWLGVSTENQETANERIPLLLRTPAAVRFISAEPLLGPIDFYECGSRGGEDGDQFAFSALRGANGVEPPIPGLDWVIVGGESGRDARPCDLAWVLSIVDQCRSAGVACFVKQLGRRPEYRDGTAMHSVGLRDSHGGDIEEWPEGLRVRQFPTPSPLETASLEISTLKPDLIVETSSPITSEASR